MYDILTGSFDSGQRAWASNSTDSNFFDKGKIVDYEERWEDSKEGDFERHKRNDESDDCYTRSPNRNTTSFGKNFKSINGGQSSSERRMTEDL